MSLDLFNKKCFSFLLFLEFSFSYFFLQLDCCLVFYFFGLIFFTQNSHKIETVIRNFDNESTLNIIQETFH